MNRDIQPEILEKIRKCLALSASSNENEAAVAAAKAADLLHKYSLSMSDIIETDKLDQPEITEAVARFGAEDDSMKHQWIVVLANAVAKTCFCKPLYSRLGVTFVGTKSESQVARQMYLDLSTAMGMMEVTSWNKNRRTAEMQMVGNPKKVRRDYRKSWMLGCSRGIENALAVQDQQFTQQAAGMALVVRRENDITGYLSQAYPSLSKFKTARQNTYGNVYKEGYAAGVQLGSSHGKAQLGSGN